MKNMKKLLSLALALSMVLSMVCTTALATEESAEDGAAQVETQSEPEDKDKSDADKTDANENGTDETDANENGTDKTDANEGGTDKTDANEDAGDETDANENADGEDADGEDDANETDANEDTDGEDDANEPAPAPKKMMRVAAEPEPQAGASGEMTSKAFLATADESGTISLTDDVTLTTSLGLSNVSLDLNGHTLNDGGKTIQVTVGQVTIKNGTVNSSHGIKVGHSKKPGQAELILDGATITGVGTTVNDSGVCAQYGAKLTVKGNTVITSGFAGIAMWDNDTDVTVENGEITGAAYAITGNGTGNTVNNLTVIGGTLSATNGVAIYHPQGGSMTIGTEDGEGPVISGYVGIQMCAGNTLTVNSGTITGTEADKGVRKTSGSMFDGGAISVIDRKYPSGGPVKVVINGGTITSEQGEAIKTYTLTGTSESKWENTVDGEQRITVSGGTFSSNVREYVANGNAQDAFGEVKPADEVTAPFGTVAMVGGTPYDTLKDALEATGENDTVTLYGTVNESVTVSRNLTLSGGTINGTVTVEADTTLTIDGVTITATKGPGIAVTGTGVELVVKGENSVTSTAKDYAGIEVPMETSLTITGEGNLYAKGNGGAGVGGSCNGGVAKWLNGEITVNMTGKLEAIGTGSQTNGNYGGAGIGAASYHNPSDIKDEASGAITVKNGTIIATGGNSCAGIGGGSHTPTGAIAIEDGNITASSAGGAGIGSGSTGKGTVEVTISGGTIDATGGWLAAGIGGSYKAGANVTITGGDITAQGGNGNAGTTYQGGPGIGGGYHADGEVSISNATIKATGGNSAPGIGTGAVSGSSKVTIISGDITAQGGCNAPGIGGGNAIKNVEVSITGGTIDAKGGTRVGGTEVMSGIGSGITQEVNDKDHSSDTTGKITIGPNAALSDGTTVGAPVGNKFYVCTVQPNGSKIYGTTGYDANTVALLTSGENTAAYSDLAQAIAAAQAGDTVQLVANVTLNAMLTLKTAGMTLDLNGKTLTVSGNPNTAIFVNGGNIRITSTAEAKGQIVCNAKNEVIYVQGALAMKLSNVVIVGGGEDGDRTGLRLYGTGTNGAEIEKCEIKNVQNGIKLYKVRTTENGPAIVSMKDTVIDAATLGMEIYMSECVLIEGCDITGGIAVVVKGNNGDGGYPTSANIIGGRLTGTAGPAVEVSDANWWVEAEDKVLDLTITAKIEDTALSGKDGSLVESVEREQTVGAVKFETIAVNTNAVCYLAQDMGAAEGDKKVFYATYAEALSKSKTITVLETTADPGSYTMAAGETVTSIGRDIEDHLVVPANCVMVKTVNEGTYTYTLRAAVPATGVALDQTALSMTVGYTTSSPVTLTATVTPDNADDKTVTWTTSDAAVATVVNGVVTPVGAGTATITATVGEVSATCTVTVTSTSAPSGGGGGGGGGGSTRPNNPSVEIDEPDVPLAELPLPFEDVKDGDWFRDSVAYVYSNDLMLGISDTLFGVSIDTTRGMIATIIYRMEKEPETAFEQIFSDVADGTWYSKSVTWASKNGVVKGYDNGGFGPEDDVTREQLVTMLYRYAGQKGLDVSKKADLGTFADADKVGDWAKDAMSWAVANGIIKGTDNNELAPTASALRVETAAIFQRFAALYEA